MKSHNQRRSISPTPSQALDNPDCNNFANEPTEPLCCLNHFYFIMASLKGDKLSKNTKIVSITRRELYLNRRGQKVTKFFAI